MRIAIGLSALALLAACGGNKAANTSSNTANASATTNATAPANGAAAQNMTAAATIVAARPVRIGIDGEHGMDACHTEGRLTGQGAIAIREAPDANARQVESGQAGLALDICESTVPGWVGVVWKPVNSAEVDCGTGANLPGPKDYDGACRSGWVAEANVEVTAG